MPPLPFASVVIPVRNEARSIESCLASVVAQEYPRDRFEVLVVDGGSTDGTRGLVERAAAGADVAIRVLDNPRRSVPAALNVALREARGELLVRVDGHSEPEPAYLASCVRGNVELGADLAGGWVEAVGETPWGRAVAAALRSPFAMGYPVSWRPPAEPIEVASVPCGSYRVEALRRIGGFDEGQLANQDYEANYRLRRAGGRVVLLPDVSFRYRTRSTPPALARQFARYGFYKARTMAKHPESVRPRHLVPAAAIVGVAAGVVPRRPAAILYAATVCAASAKAGRGLGRDALLLPAVLATMHAAWGAGNVAGLARWLPVARKLR